MQTPSHSLATLKRLFCARLELQVSNDIQIASAKGTGKEKLCSSTVLHCKFLTVIHGK